jgi:hypothetical protein
MTGTRTTKGEFLTRNPSAVAKALCAHFEGAPEPAEFYTEPHIVRHSYEGFDKIRRLGKSAPSAARVSQKAYAESYYERIKVIDSEAAVTVLLTTKVRTHMGREFRIEAAMVHLLNETGKIYRVEAYYDPRELEREAWLGAHLAMYDGVEK